MDSVELNPDEQEEKERLIQQLLELRNTLDGELFRLNLLNFFVSSSKNLVGNLFRK